jgi:hypothetical protein
MKLFPAISALVALAAAPAIASASVFLDFEQNWEYGQVVDSTYAAQGVTFTNVLGVSNDPANFGYYFNNAPSSQGVAMVQLDGITNTAAFMNVSAGVFSNGASFFFSTPSNVAGAVKAYSGLNGTGDLLGTLDLAANDDGSYSTWTQATVNFTGIAKSFDLSATAGLAGFDNVAINAVPEPESYALGLVGLGLVGAIARRRQQA